MGYKYISIQQCDFYKEIKSLYNNLYDHYLPKYYTKNKGPLTERKIKTYIANGQLFGMVEVDISVKEEFKNFFQNFHHFSVPVKCQCQT